MITKTAIDTSLLLQRTIALPCTCSRSIRRSDQHVPEQKSAALG